MLNLPLAQAKAAKAYAQIIQMINYYGEVVEDEEWEDTTILKYDIVLQRDGTKWDYSIVPIYAIKYFLSFHSQEEAQRFLDTNEDLVRDYYMI